MQLRHPRRLSSNALYLLYALIQTALSQPQGADIEAQVPFTDDSLRVPSHTIPKVELGLAVEGLDIDGGEACDSTNGVCNDEASIGININTAEGKNEEPEPGLPSLPKEEEEAEEFCNNKHVSCDFWASTGECQDNPSYMMGNCKRACGNCKGMETPKEIEPMMDSDMSTEKQERSLTQTITQMSELTFDENQKLASYQLVFPADNPNCPAPIYGGWYGYKKTALLSGPALELIFPDYTVDSNEECVAACLERGTDHAVAGHTMPQFHYQQDRDGNFNDWFRKACAEKEICLMNYMNENNALDMYWVKPETLEEKPTGNLHYGEPHTKCFFSFLGHNFKIYDNTTVVDTFTVEHVTTRPIGKFTRPPTQPGHNFEREILGTLDGEWGRHKVVKRTFSSLGFAKGKLPRDVFATMGSFYYNNRKDKSPEEWRSRGVFVNWWETDVFYIQVPWKLKEVWQTRLADLVSEWAGVPCEETVMYGLRQYEDGARLLTHVDRTPTHAVSLIINVAQGNLAEPWPVEVFDHADRLHEVLMEPGEIVYYESAKNLHSRNRPLKGENAYYVNLFTHYRPIGDGDRWHQVLDQKGVPLPVDDNVVGECVVGETDQDYPPYGKVKCEDDRLGQYISPTLVQAKKPKDLVAWWRRTAPGYVEEGKYPINLMTTKSRINGKRAAKKRNKLRNAFGSKKDVPDVGEVSDQASIYD